MSFLCVVLLLFAKSFAVEDLEIVGSDNHFTYLPKAVEGNVAGVYRRRLDFESEEEPKINFPVKTVQKFTDSEGNVKIVTSYSQRDENPLPIYHDTQLRQTGMQKARDSASIDEPQKGEPQFRKQVAYAAHIEPRSRPSTKEFSTSKTVKLPKEGRLYANQHETESSDGTKSSYNQKSSYTSKYKKPPVKSLQSTKTENIKEDKSVSNAPLEEAGSSYVSDIDSPGIVEDSSDVGGYGGGEEFSVGSTSFGSNGLSNVGEGPGIYESGVDDGDDYNHHHGGFENLGHGHEYKKGHGESHHHGNSASKGDQGGKGFKKNENYQKGHAESHGREEEKGGNKEESGIKSGSLDEGSNYAKGHQESSGEKGAEQAHSKGHKKGHKTKGFRTVHHKDEYKKDEVFYDEEHDAGHTKGHGQEQQAHKNAKGGNTKKGHLHSGYKNAEKGYQGDKEKGQSYKNSKGHSGSQGGHQYHGHQSHHDKGGGHKGGESHGHEHYSKGH